MLDRGTADLVWVERNVIEMALGAGLDGLIEVVDGHRLGSNADLALRIDRLGRIVGSHDDAGIIRGGLVAPGAVGRLVPYFPVLDPSFAVLDDFRDVFLPALDVIDRQMTWLVLSVPLHIAMED